MFYGLSRYLCDVLDEMSKCSDTGNYSSLPSLVNEARLMGNRMESKLRDQKDWESLKDDISQKKKEIRQLKSEIRALEELKGILTK